MNNNKYNTRDVLRACRQKLGIEFRDGKELNGWYESGGRRIARITVPKGRKPLPPKTYATMARQLKLQIDQFDALLSCELTSADYARLIAG
jgi:hypothetical protein